MILKSDSITPKQKEYIAILFIDCGYTPTQAKGWLELRYGVKYSDELSKAQASSVIEELKLDKESKKTIPKEED